MTWYDTDWRTMLGKIVADVSDDELPDLVAALAGYQARLMMRQRNGDQHDQTPDPLMSVEEVSKMLAAGRGRLPARRQDA